MILHGDCIEQMKTLPDNSVDAVVTDPPYGWRFMGKAWDGADIEKIFARDKTLEADNKTTMGMAAGKYDQALAANEAFQEFSRAWAVEAYRVLKPGGHMLVFCGPRTYHRMASGVEDAGFEIRDQLQWLFGSGFPKSHNIGKSIDKISGLIPIKVADGRSGNSSRAYQSEEKTTAGAYEITKSNNEWDGWGSALKPANEPIVLARKPLEKGLTLAQNVLKWGTGGLNIDASRIGYAASENVDFSKVQDGNIYGGNGIYGEAEQKQTTPLFKSNGRWPANLILDETAAEMLPVENKQSVSRFFYVAKASKSERNAGLEGEIKEKQGARPNSADSTGKFPDHDHRPSGGNNHPTVKPTKLMGYLCRLVTPPLGTILDPFTGSGSTGVAATKLGFKFIGCEMNEEYVQIAQKRISNVET